MPRSRRERPSWIVAPCSPVRKAEHERATTVTSAARGRRCIWQSTPRQGCLVLRGDQRRKGSKVHLAVDTLGHLLALIVTPANVQDRAQVADLVEQAQQATGDTVEVAFVDQGYTGDEPAKAAAVHGIRLEAVKLPTAKRGFVLLPRRWVVERSFAWVARFRRLARDYERLAESLAGLHFVAFAILMAHRFVSFMVHCA